MSMKKKILLALVIVLVIGAGIFVVYNRGIASMSRKSVNESSTTVSVKFINSTITADGTVTAQNQAKLNFQTPGKLVYLPFKEGDAVSVGQTIAQLDTYELQRELTAALNTYKITRDTFDQTLQNSQDDALKTQLTPTYSSVNIEHTDAIGAAIQRIVDQNQASLGNSVINVELANYALQLSRLTSPLRGIITHEDVTVPGINITQATSFTVADPSSMVFRQMSQPRIFTILPKAARSLWR